MINLVMLLVIKCYLNSKYIKNNIRKSDLLARWGGEEFVIAYLNSSFEDSLITTEKLKSLIENDYILKN